MEPGKRIENFTTKSGKQVIFRYLRESDVDEMLRYINTISREDTFITFSGEQMTREMEEVFVKDTLNRMKEGDNVTVVVEHNGKIIGNSGISRKTSDKARGRHIGVFGISLEKECRGEWIGQRLMEIVIQEAVRNLPGLRIIQLQCYATNVGAIKLYKGVGFVEYGRLPGGVLHRGEYVDLVEMYKEV